MSYKQLRPCMNYGMNDEEKHCLECGDPIPYGRPDKAFCSAKCKNRHYYVHHAGGRFARTRVDAILARNYSLLLELVDDNVESMDLQTLTMKGFKPEYLTYHKSGRYYSECACFDIRYRQTRMRVYGLEKL